MPETAPQPGARARRGRSLVPYIVLAVSLALTLVSTSFADRTARARDALRFDMAVETARDQIQHHIRTYISLLRGGAGLFAASEDVTLPEFQRYVDRLEVADNYEGVQGIGYSLRVPAARKAAVEARMRAYYPDFHIWPDTPRPVYYPIVYLQPMDTLNRRAIGYDMFSNPVRRAAMVRARDTGEPATSGKVRLVQEGKATGQPGFLIYVPVYRTDRPPKSVAERRAAFVGYVYSAFRTNDLLRGIFEGEQNPQICFDIWDGPVRTPDHLLHRAEGTPGEIDRPEFTWDTILPVAGRDWSIHFESTREFHNSSGRDVVPIVFFSGLFISGLLFAVTFGQVRSHDAAERAAEDLRRSRDAAERAAEELRRSEARARRLVESNVIGVAFQNLDGRLTEANDAFLDMLGYTRDDLLRLQLRWTDLTPPEYRARDMEAVAELRRTGTHASYEKEYIHRDGHRIPVLVGAALLEPDSELAVSYIVDITARKQAEEAVREGREQLRRLYVEAEDARAAAEEANRLKDDFLATVSHELRTPLNAILGYAQLLRLGNRRPEDVTRALEAIERNVKAQAQLIEDLLDVSRIVSGKLRLDRQTVDPAEVVRAAVESVLPAAAEKGVTLLADLDPHAGLVPADPGRLQQIVWNLLTNAIKFTPAGGRVDVVLRGGASHVEVTVRDTGIGIGPEFIAHIFDRFRQVDSSTTRRHGGLGLGLSIVRHLVELHGGEVHAESAGEGQGSVFTVTLPREVAGQPAEEAPRKAAEAPRAVEPSLPPLDGLRVLVVDDEPDARTVVQGILEGRGATVQTAASARAALSALPDFRPHVLLSDIGMPDEDGYSLIGKVRELSPEDGGSVPAAALTAFARVEDRHRALLAGFQMHITKPVDPAGLVMLVATLAGRAGRSPVPGSK